MTKPFYYGGQAVIEGVMMRGRDSLAISVRSPDGKLNIKKQPLSSIYKGRLRETPFVRGVIVLIEALVLGTQALLHSAQVASAQEEGEEKMPPALLWGSVVASLAFGVALFFVAPLLATRYLIDPYIGSALISNLVEGIIRIGIFVAYLKLIGLIPDIKRVFAYHGAEHKTVNAYEAGTPLEAEAIRSYSTAHARCGTGFIFIVLILAILIFALLGRPTLWLSITSRIVLIPVIAALGYEIMKFGASHAKNAIIRILLAPGLMLQAMTTREPDDSQLEAAISALNEVIEADKVVDICYNIKPKEVDKMTKSVKWLSHAGFIVSTPGGKTIIIDPWITENPLCPIKLDDITTANIVLVTHDHFDHAGNAVDIVNKTGATLVAQPETVNRFKKDLGLSDERIIFGGFGMNIGGSATIDGITITMTQAFHSSETGSPSGYIIKLEDGTTIYHAGDTGIFESMRLLGELYSIDLALLPIGSAFTMDPYQAAKALTLLKPKRVIPMHYKTFPILEQSADSFVELAKKEAPEVEVVVLQPGEEYSW